MDIFFGIHAGAKKLRRLYDLFDAIDKFLQTADNNVRIELNNRRVHLAYLSHIFDKQKEVNLELQEKQENVIKVKSVVMSFINKLTLFQQNVG